jgi:hypothetical protein
MALVFVFIPTIIFHPMFTFLKLREKPRLTKGSETERPTFLAVWNMSNKDATKALNLAIEHQTELLEKWREIHEEPRFDGGNLK